MGGPTSLEVDGKMMMGLSIYGVAVISGSLYSRFYGILGNFHIKNISRKLVLFSYEHLPIILITQY